MSQDFKVSQSQKDFQKTMRTKAEASKEKSGFFFTETVLVWVFIERRRR